MGVWWVQFSIVDIVRSDTGRTRHGGIGTWGTGIGVVVRVGVLIRRGWYNRRGP